MKACKPPDYVKVQSHCDRQRTASANEPHVWQPNRIERTISQHARFFAFSEILGRRHKCFSPFHLAGFNAWIMNQVKQ